MYACIHRSLHEGSQGSDESSNSCSIDNEGIQAHPIPIVMVSATAMETAQAQLSIPLSTTNTTMPMRDDLYSSTMLDDLYSSTMSLSTVPATSFFTQKKQLPLLVIHAKSSTKPARSFHYCDDDDDDDDDSDDYDDYDDDDNSEANSCCGGGGVTPSRITQPSIIKATLFKSPSNQW